MAPSFKKPLEYNPGLAAETLSRANERSDDAREKKKMAMLAELGLGDEGYDIEDEDDDDDDDDDDDTEDDDAPMLPDEGEQPIFSNGSRNKAAASPGSSARQPASYSYRDVFGREFQRKRQQQIDYKGYNRFLEQLLSRSSESLQLLRSDNSLQYPGSVEIIGELEHELKTLCQENSELKETAANSVASPVASPSMSGAAADKRVKMMDAELVTFREQIVGLERLVKSKDERIRDLQAQLRQAKEEVGASAATVVGGAAVGAAAMSAETKRQLAELEAENAELASGNAALASDLAASRSEAQRKTAELASTLANMSNSADSSGVQAARLAVEVSTLTAAALAHGVQVSKLEKELQKQTVEMAQLKSQNTAMGATAAQARSAAASEVSGKLDHMYQLIDEMHKLRESVLSELLAVQSELFNEKALKEMTRGVRDKEIEMTRKIRAGSAQEVVDALQRAQDAEEEIAGIQARCDQQLHIQQLEVEGMTTHFKDKWKAEFDRRRKLHNQVLELKGNIRVLCRVRPLLAKEKANAGSEEPPVKVVSEELIKVPAGPNGQGDKEYEFDRVFGLEEGQEQVFDEVRALVVSVLDGYNVSIMAYGQTGSGKTFTMEGPDSNPGVNARSLSELFTMADERKGVFDYTFSASVLEIYNEQIFDLLAGGRDQEDKLDVKQNTDGKMHVPGLMVEVVANVEEVTRVINIGKGNRSTFATNMNEHSSRSHLVLSVYITGVNTKTNTTIKGKLHLIDLAGSERIARTNAQGDRLKEAQNINKSLSALGDVIQALQQKQAHIPYRNSKLTRLLEDSLGNNSKCVMVVNCSPAAENTGETKCSLEFASRARKVELGKAKANTEGSPKSARGSPGSTTPNESLSRGGSQGSLNAAVESAARGASKLRFGGTGR